LSTNIAALSSSICRVMIRVSQGPVKRIFPSSVSDSRWPAGKPSTRIMLWCVAMCYTKQLLSLCPSSHVNTPSHRSRLTPLLHHGGVNGLVQHLARLWVGQFTGGLRFDFDISHFRKTSRNLTLAAVPTAPYSICPLVHTAGSRW
jgi:hypothetical protein